MQRIWIILESEEMGRALSAALASQEPLLLPGGDVGELLTRFRPEPPELPEGDILAEQLLEQFGLHIRPRLCTALREAIVMWAGDPDNMLTKHVYLQVCHSYDGSTDALDQALRRGLRRAWANRSSHTPGWELLFPGCGQCPTNGDFIRTLGEFLHKKYPSRFRKGS